MLRLLGFISAFGLVWIAYEHQWWDRLPLSMTGLPGQLTSVFPVEVTNRERDTRVEQESVPPVIEPTPVATVLPVRDVAVWQPFASQRSAEGFRQYLEQRTGLVFRVDAVPDGYQVWYEYRKDAELALLESRLADVGAKVGG